MTREVRDAPQFYLTAPSPCPYLPGMMERKVFTHLVGKRAAALNDMLTQTGFRRSQTIAYRPACENCRGCVSVRVVVDDFKPSASQRRILRENADLIGVDDARQADRRAIFAVSRLSRRAPSRRRHGRHVGARLFDDGRGQPYRHRHHRIPPARDRHVHHRPRRGPAGRRLPHRPARRRPFAGLFVLRLPRSRGARSAPT